MRGKSDSELRPSADLLHRQLQARRVRQTARHALNRYRGCSQVAFPLAVSVNVLLVEVGLGAKPAVTPLGSPEALNVTFPLKPLKAFTVIVLVALLPWVTATEFGLALKLKSGDPPQPGS